MSEEVVNNGWDFSRYLPRAARLSTAQHHGIEHDMSCFDYVGRLAHNQQLPKHGKLYLLRDQPGSRRCYLLEDQCLHAGKALSALKFL
jgi:hypothetical protein